MARNRSLDMGELTDTLYYILLSLVAPRHGYLIMKNIETITDGEFEIGPASLYSSIQKLESAGLIERVDIDDQKRKTYQATDKGIQLLKMDVQRRRVMVRHAEEILKLEGYY
ncbi:PadR family transcriptional regulator [Virgibacillus siamensis]|uniref:PadR family transcriptional regulator n=1 Tax=Virgibacillus siamensis TaxID=480071 RepID=A0ABN1FMC3_9BACI